MVITRDQIEKIKAEASCPDVQEGLVSMIPNEVVSLCDLAIKGLDGLRAEDRDMKVAATTFEKESDNG